MLLPLLLGGVLAVSADRLVQIQVVYRHGDRTPIDCFPTDPNLPFWETLPKGELTTTGMRQQYNQGLKMKNRYIDTFQFINSTYKREEILVRSSLSPRCIQSAAANLAGFYSGSKGTLPTVAGWPSNWTPVPIHSLEKPLQHMLDPGDGCARDDVLSTKRGDNAQFVDYEFAHAEMIAEIAELSGDGITDIPGLIHFYDCIRIEKEFYNMTLAHWITNKLYNNMTDLYWRTGNFIHGGADFGKPDDLELIRVRGGALLTEILDRMQAAIAGDSTTKMFAYSAHDTTLVSLWRTLGNKNAMVGVINPDYAAHYIFELWKSDAGSYYIKTLYLANEGATFTTTTSNIQGCGGGDSCDFVQFNERCKPYLVNHIEELCDNPV